MSLSKPANPSSSGVLTVEREITLNDGEEAFLFHTGWSVFSNFHVTPFIVNGQRYLTVQQFYEATKARHFKDVDAEMAILKCRSARKCKLLGRTVRNFNYQEWLMIADEVMSTAIKEKFMQNTKCREALLNTGKKLIAEASEYDANWTTGLNIDDDDVKDRNKWQGENKLGKILMEVRNGLADTD